MNAKVFHASNSSYKEDFDCKYVKIIYVHWGWRNENRSDPRRYEYTTELVVKFIKLLDQLFFFSFFFNNESSRFCYVDGY